MKYLFIVEKANLQMVSVKGDSSLWYLRWKWFVSKHQHVSFILPVACGRFRHSPSSSLASTFRHMRAPWSPLMHQNLQPMCRLQKLAGKEFWYLLSRHQEVSLCISGHHWANIGDNAEQQVPSWMNLHGTAITAPHPGSLSLRIISSCNQVFSTKWLVSRSNFRLSVSFDQEMCGKFVGKAVKFLDFYDLNIPKNQPLKFHQLRNFFRQLCDTW